MKTGGRTEVNDFIGSSDFVISIFLFPIETQICTGSSIILLKRRREPCVLKIYVRSFQCVMSLPTVGNRIMDCIKSSAVYVTSCYALPSPLYQLTPSQSVQETSDNMFAHELEYQIQIFFEDPYFVPWLVRFAWNCVAHTEKYIFNNV